jgi:uncharacterized protein YndB with AHSA1/START domain
VARIAARIHKEKNMSSQWARGLTLGLALIASAAHADVMQASAASMSIRTVVAIDAPAGKVYDAFLEIGRWWNKEHTYSGDSANLKLSATPGGCFCEELPGGGGVVHMTVVNVAPNRRLTLFGALGPLQTSGASGAMTLSFVAKPSGMELVMTYNVGGYFPDGLQAQAPAVDEVLTQQLKRLKSFVETGNPDAAPHP